jgi:Cu2+-exporting ATPase
MPTAFLGALNHITRHGILVRSGRTLELLADVDTVVFDKTGTLTQGQIAVVKVETIDGRLSQDEILQLAASAEQRITHPVAEAIADYAQQQGIEVLQRNNWDYAVGLGMKAEIGDKTVLVGSKRFLLESEIDLSLETHLFMSEGLHAGRSLIYVACNGDFQGIIEYADPLRPESPALIEKLQKEWGMSVHLLTGDNQQRASQVAKVLNSPENNVHAEAFPEHNVIIVRDLHRSGRTVAFVGDGLNDSVALAYADVSISFAAGSEVARETADVVLMENDLDCLAEALLIAKNTKSLIEQNTFLVVAPNLTALGLASTVGLNPLVATAIHNGTAIAAGLNSLRPLAQHQLENSQLMSLFTLLKFQQ